MRELYRRSSSPTGVLDRGRGRASSSAEVEAQLREAHERLRASFGRRSRAASRDDEPVPRPTAPRRRDAPSRRSGSRRSDRAAAARPGGLHRATRSSRASSSAARPRSTEGGIDWGHAEALAFASLLRRRDPDPADRPGHRARHVLAPPPRPARRASPGEIDIADAAPRRRDGLVRGLQLAALRVRVRRASSTATRPPRPRRSCSGRPSSATSPTARRSIIDQFISSGLAKWRQTSRLTLLLPHGYEGNGPEHSSARLERFLQLGAQENIRIANCTTAAQYFHLLRRQALDPIARPLVVMTPKGLLRLKDAVLDLAELAEGTFRPVLDDATADKCERSGASSSAPARSTTTSSATSCARERRGDRRRADRAALPVPGRGDPRADRVVPVARRDRLGAGGAAEHGRLAHDPPPARGGGRGSVPVRYVGRPWRASTAEGYPTAHSIEQDRIARAVLDALMSCAAPLLLLRPPTLHGRRAGRAWRAWSASASGAATAAAAARVEQRAARRPTGPARRAARPCRRSASGQCALSPRSEARPCTNSSQIV